MFRFTIRDVLWLTVVVALAASWLVEHETALDELERASGREKIGAATRLNRAVRRFDFVGYAKVPRDLHVEPSTYSEPLKHEI